MVPPAYECYYTNISIDGAFLVDYFILGRHQVKIFFYVAFVVDYFMLSRHQVKIFICASYENIHPAYDHDIFVNDIILDKGDAMVKQYMCISSKVMPHF
jgi:hypothetical protein